MEVNKSGGYRKMHSFAFVCIIYHATTLFCKRNFNYRTDPLGKTSGQMIGAARSARQNIVEGSSRREFSRQQELLQYSVAKGSLDELAGDYETFIYEQGEDPWGAKDGDAETVAALKVDTFDAHEDVPKNYSIYLRTMTQRFAPWLHNENPLIAAQSIYLTIRRAVGMLTNQMRAMVSSETDLAAGPRCPECGAQMVKRTAKKGPRAGQQFWSCMRYPDCGGAISIEMK